jgi:Fanconi anemia group M protein
MTYLYASKKRTAKMKKIAKNLTSRLQPIIRVHEKPNSKPLAVTELKTLEKEAKHVKDELENMQSESASLKEFNKTIDRISQSIYMKLLERGPKGASLGQIILDIDYDEPSTAILKAAINKLIKSKLVTELGIEKFVISSALKASRRKIYKITVEKIYQGQAVVRINDKWRARLLSQEYNGPRNLIKKNSTFTAAGELYKTNGTLCLRINEVTQIIS